MNLLSVVMMLAVILSMAVICVQMFRVVQRSRAKDGEAVLRENRRLASALVVCCVCYAAGRALFNYGDQDGASMLWCLVSGVKDSLPLAVTGVCVCYMSRKKGLALREKTKSDLGE